VPSFFTSPSLVNMGGLGVADQTNLSAPDSAQVAYDAMRKDGEQKPPEFQVVPVDGELQPGWAGKGLRGNHSAGSLYRSNSGASGLFLMDNDNVSTDLKNMHTMH
jgi:hypothetical protein